MVLSTTNFCSLAVVLVWFSNIGSILGDANCDDVRECAGDSITENSGNVDCDGLASCYNASISSNYGDFSLECGGTRGCQDITLNTDGNATVAEIDGYLGLSFANVIEFNGGTTTLECSAEASCFGINVINNLNELLCSGARSCGDINEGNIISTIYGYGMFSLMNSVLYSNNTDDGNSDTINVYLYGFFAGYNGSFYCQSSSKCNVYCSLTGCANFNVICDDDAGECNIDCDEDNGDICPNGYNADSDSVDSLIDDYFNYLINNNEPIENIFYKNYSNDIDYENDIECPNDDMMDDISCGYSGDDNADSYLGCYNDGPFTLKSGSFCCNGRSSCGYNTINMTNSFTNSSFNDSSDSDDRILYCNGGRSCDSTTIDLNYNDMYCRGASCGDDTYRFDSIIGSSENSFFNSEIVDGNYLGCFGHKSCYLIDTYRVNVIYATGHESLYWSDIISNGTNLDVYLLVKDIGFFTEIICSGNDTCNIYALDNDYGDLYRAECDSSNQCNINYFVFQSDSGSDGDSDSGSDSDNESDDASNSDNTDSSNGDSSNNSSISSNTTTNSGTATTTSNSGNDDSGDDIWQQTDNSLKLGHSKCVLMLTVFSIIVFSV